MRFAETTVTVDAQSCPLVSQTRERAMRTVPPGSGKDVRFEIVVGTQSAQSSTDFTCFATFVPCLDPVSQLVLAAALAGSVAGVLHRRRRSTGATHRT